MRIIKNEKDLTTAHDNFYKKGLNSGSIISVIIPTYNRGADIAPTIDSVLSQTLPREQYEIIIVDDGSTDDTLAFLQHEYSNHENIHIISQSNGGVANARNKGLKVARGDFIAFLDHDDLWLPAKLQKQLAVLQQQPGLAVVYCGAIIVEDGERQEEVVVTDWPQGNVYARLLRSNFLVSMSVPLVRSSALRRIGGFANETAPNDDWDLWLRLAQNHRFGAVEESLVLYCRHENQLSLGSAKMIETTRVVYKRQRGFAMKNRRFWLVWALTSTRTVAYQSTYPLFVQARSHLFAGRFAAVALCWLRAFSSPAAPFSAQWLYLLKRALCRDSRPY